MAHTAQHYQCILFMLALTPQQHSDIVFLTPQQHFRHCLFSNPTPTHMNHGLLVGERERLFGTGSSTNAYTDFHHTVFYASCPVLTPPGWGRPTPMLGRALGALLDVLEVRKPACGR